MDLVALEEIRQVKYRYLRCVDLKLWDEMAEVFTADATADYGSPATGQPLKFGSRDEIIAFLRDKLGPDIITLHAAGQPEIDVDGDTATGRWRFTDMVIALQYRVRIEGPLRPRRGRQVADLTYRLRAHLRDDAVAG